MASDELIVLNAIALVFSLAHVFGLYLLFQTRHSLDEIQWLFLTNLSVAELLYILISVLERLIRDEIEFKKVLLFFNHTSVVFIYYSCMFLITGNRFFQMYLNVRYHLWITYGRTKRLMVILWVIGISFSVFALVSRITIIEFNRIGFLYVYPVLNISLLVLILVTYTYVSCLIGRKRRRVVCPQPSTSDGFHKQSRASKKLNGLLLPSSFIVTYVIFILVPDLLITYSTIHPIRYKYFEFICYVMYYAGFAVDAVIYIFLSAPIRKELLKVLRLR